MPSTFASNVEILPLPLKATLPSAVSVVTFASLATSTLVPSASSSTITSIISLLISTFALLSTYNLSAGASMVILSVISAEILILPTSPSKFFAFKLAAFLISTVGSSVFPET